MKMHMTREKRRVVDGELITYRRVVGNTVWSFISRVKVHREFLDRPLRQQILRKWSKALMKRRAVLARVDARIRASL